MKLLVFASLAAGVPAHFFIRAFRDLGHEVCVVSDIAAPGVDVQARGAVDAGTMAADFAPDAALFFEGGTMRLLPVGLGRLGCPTAWYGIDTHTNYAKHLRLARLFDVSFIAQKEFVEALRQDGIRQVHWLPLGFPAELLPKILPERDLDIAYVGSTDARVHPERQALIAMLKESFSAAYFGGATPTEMIQIYARARLVFNRSLRNDVNMRFFEAMGAGAVLITDLIVDNGVESLFTEGEHYFTYRDAASLSALVEDLLADPERIAGLGWAAQRHVLTHHTYRHRAVEMLEALANDARCARTDAADEFAACLSLNLAADALAAAARAFDGADARRVVAHPAACGLRGLAHLAGVAEVVLRRMRPR